MITHLTRKSSHIGEAKVSKASLPIFQCIFAIPRIRLIWKINWTPHLLHRDTQQSLWKQHLWGVLLVNKKTQVLQFSSRPKVQELIFRREPCSIFRHDFMRPLSGLYHHWSIPLWISFSCLSPLQHFHEYSLDHFPTRDISVISLFFVCSLTFLSNIFLMYPFV